MAPIYLISLANLFFFCKTNIVIIDTNMYNFNITLPNFDTLGYVIAVVNTKDKHDRSAPSDYHWKILKCRMIIFSASSLLACPDKNNEKKVHIIFSKIGNDYDCVTTLLNKYSLTQAGGINEVTSEIFLVCFQYTMAAKIAPVWNVLGYNYFINNRDFLTSLGPQEGVKCQTSITNNNIKIDLKPVRINIIKSPEMYPNGELVRVLPSLNKATVEEFYENLPPGGDFKSYKDLRRHWKNIHGYRLPEIESAYYAVRFWRGDPLIYPAFCLTRNYPIITPIPKSHEIIMLRRFLDCLKNKMQYFLGMPLKIDKDIEVNSNYCVNTLTVLINLFIKYNSAIPSSAVVESLFSTGKDILRAKRSSLSDFNFNMLIFMKGNMHLNYLMQNNDEPDDDE